MITEKMVDAAAEWMHTTIGATPKRNNVRGMLEAALASAEPPAGVPTREEISRALFSAAYPRIDCIYGTTDAHNACDAQADYLLSLVSAAVSARDGELEAKHAKLVEVSDKLRAERLRVEKAEARVAELEARPAFEVSALPCALFYSIDDEGQIDTHVTAEDAREAAESSIECDGEWADGVDGVEWGVLVSIQEAQETDRVEPDAESDDARAQMAAANGWSYWCDYKLVDARAKRPSPAERDYGGSLADANRILRDERDAAVARCTEWRRAVENALGVVDAFGEHAPAWAESVIRHDRTASAAERDAAIARVAKLDADYMKLLDRASTQGAVLSERAEAAERALADITARLTAARKACEELRDKQEPHVNQEDHPDRNLPSYRMGKRDGLNFAVCALGETAEPTPQPVEPSSHNAFGHTGTDFFAQQDMLSQQCAARRARRVRYEVSAGRSTVGRDEKGAYAVIDGERVYSAPGPVPASQEELAARVDRLEQAVRELCRGLKHARDGSQLGAMLSNLSGFVLNALNKETP